MKEYLEFVVEKQKQIIDFLKKENEYFEENDYFEDFIALKQITILNEVLKEMVDEEPELVIAEKITKLLQRR